MKYKVSEVFDLVAFPILDSALEFAYRCQSLFLGDRFVRSNKYRRGRCRSIEKIQLMFVIQASFLS